MLYIQVLTSNLGYLWRIPRVAALESHSSIYIFEHRWELMLCGVNYVSLNAVAHEISECLWKGRLTLNKISIRNADIVWKLSSLLQMPVIPRFICWMLLHALKGLNIYTTVQNNLFYSPRLAFIWSQYCKKIKLLQFEIFVFYLNIFYNVIYSWDAKLNTASLL